jgi:hypothetical protein
LLQAHHLQNAARLRQKIRVRSRGWKGGIRRVASGSEHWILNSRRYGSDNKMPRARERCLVRLRQSMSRQYGGHWQDDIAETFSVTTMAAIAGMPEAA